MQQHVISSSAKFHAKAWNYSSLHFVSLFEELAWWPPFLVTEFWPLNSGTRPQLSYPANTPPTHACAGGSSGIRRHLHSISMNNSWQSTGNFNLLQCMWSIQFQFYRTAKACIFFKGKLWTAYCCSYTSNLVTVLTPIACRIIIYMNLHKI